MKDSTQSAAVECMEQPGEYSTQSTAVGEDSPQSTADKHMEETAEYSPQSTAWSNEMIISGEEGIASTEDDNDEEATSIKWSKLMKRCKYVYTHTCI